MNPVSLVHPSAPAPAAPQGPAPRYLVRGDGVVLDYNPWLARLPGFTPADVLPPAHLAQIAAAQERDAALARVLAARQPQATAAQADTAQPPAAPEPKARLVTIRASELPAAPVVERRIAEPVPPHAPVAAGPHEAEAIARARFRAQLKPVFDRAGLAMDLRKPMESLRAEALATLKPAAVPAPGKGA